jgi:hypothetical protein
MADAANAVAGMVLDSGKEFAAAQRQQNLGSWK